MRTFIILLITTACTCVRAQMPSLSPAGELTQVVGSTTLTVNYERPTVRGRKIFGGLVPWNEVWRTGAGYCTKLGFDREVIVAGQPVPAGRYALLTIPGPEEWVVILNTDVELYGSRDYAPTKDVIRFRTPTKTAGRHYEAMTIELDLMGDNAHLYLAWDDTQIDFPIETSTAGDINRYVNRLLSAPASDTLDYAWPAEYLLLSRRNLNAALQLADRQIKVKEGEYPWRIKMEIYDYLGYRQQAIAAAKNALAYVKANPMDEKNQAWSLNYWSEQLARLRKSRP